VLQYLPEMEPAASWLIIAGLFLLCVMLAWRKGGG
jgi:hypothetical protein